jgi:hypothetical protein
MKHHPERILIASAADCQKGYFRSLTRQVHSAGIDFLWKQLVPFSWRRLLLWELEVAQAYPQTTIVFVDSWDMLFLGTRDELVEVLSDQSLLFHSEKVCWPHSYKANSYPAATSQWRFVNGTGPAGSADSISAAIEYGMSHFPLLGDGTGTFDVTIDNDQRFWTDVYLSGMGKLDTECRLSQSLVDAKNGDFTIRDGRLINNVTGTKPLFVHANGAQSMIGFRHMMDMLSGELSCQ